MCGIGYCIVYVVLWFNTSLIDVSRNRLPARGLKLLDRLYLMVMFVVMGIVMDGVIKLFEEKT